MKELRLQAPEFATFRDDVDRLLADSNIDGKHVVIDCEKMLTATPSFMDELVRRVLVEGKAEALSFVPVYRRTVELSRRVGRAHGVTGKVTTFASRSEFERAFGHEFAATGSMPA